MVSRVRKSAESSKRWILLKCVCRKTVNKGQVTHGIFKKPRYTCNARSQTRGNYNYQKSRERANKLNLVPFINLTQVCG